MGILTGAAIAAAVKCGDISIDPFRKEQLNPNSYNLRLGKQFCVYSCKTLDAKQLNEYRFFDVGEEGILLEPGQLYLGATVERTRTDKYVPMIEGRSSLARLGLFVHITAGFGDIGYEGCWTLEFTCVKPVRIYPNMEVAQIYYLTPEGKVDRLYKSRKYQGNYGVQPSMGWLDF